MKKNVLSKDVAPIVKWVGGKRQLIPQIKKYIPKDFNKYYEPFIGGGALLFSLQPKKAIINDINPELSNLYRVVKDNVEELIHELSLYKNEEEFFYKTRELDRNKKKYSSLSNVTKASRLIFLNKTCFNGLFRVNNQGEFNTPFGKYKNPKIVDEITLRAVSNYFNTYDIKILSTDYEEAVKGIRKNDFVYMDPPYDPISTSANFTGYNKGGFDKSEQERLKKLCDKLSKRNVKFLLSNSATDFILELYKDYNIEIVKAKRLINSDADKRGEIEEVLVRNYE